MNMKSLTKLQDCGSVQHLMFMLTYAICSSVNILFIASLLFDP